MKIRAIDENNDWTFGKGLQDYKTQSDAIRQDIKTAIQEWVGDCFFANNNGIDWKNRLEKNQQKNTEAEVKSLIVKRDGVVAVLLVNSILINRVLTIYYKVKTIYSDIIEDSVEVGV